jgi:hypothetical protein
VGGGVLGLDTLGNFVLGSLGSTGGGAAHEGTISATLSIDTISAALEVGSASAAISVDTISAEITVNDSGG